MDEVVFGMRQSVVRLLRLFGGIFLYALGIVFILKANIGYAPWEVFHVGISYVTGMSIGVASILTGFIIVLVVFIFKEKLGLGTIVNMVFIGVFLDFIVWLHVLPTANNMFFGIAMLIIGLFIIALGSYFYIGSGFGAGPRDSLMVLLTRKTKLPVGVCRTSIELLVLVVGWMLGGMVGVGTIISVFGIGFCVQVTFKLLKFDTTSIQHETIDQTYKKLLQAKLARK